LKQSCVGPCGVKQAIMTIDETLALFIKHNPGTGMEKLKKEFTGFTEAKLKKLLVPLEISRKITRVGNRYWDAEDFPEIAPRLNSLIYFIKRNKGTTIDQLSDQLNLPRGFVKREVEFLIEAREIYVVDGFLHSNAPTTMSEPSRFSIGELQLLSRSELVAIASRLLETATYLLSEYETINQIIQERKQELANTPAFSVPTETVREESKPEKSRLSLDFRGIGHRH
jgi:hypothetical protein